MAVALGPAQVAWGQLPQFDVIELSPPPGFERIGAAEVNNRGQVVGTLERPDGVQNAFVWDRASGARPLGTANGLSTVGSGINEAGDVAASVPQTVFFISDVPLLWTAVDGFQALQQIAGSPGGFSHAVNESRQVAGSAGNGSRQPARWDAEGRLELLSPLGNGGGTAFDINASGQVAGWSRNATFGSPRPVLWDAGTGVRDLGSFSGGEFGTGQARALNDRGQVTGTTSSGSSGLGRAFLWENGRLTAIAPELSDGWGINEAGDVVGRFTAFEGRKKKRVSLGDRAFLYRAGSLFDLNDALPQGSGILLDLGVDINDAGTILASGTNRAGQRRSFVLVPR